MIARRDSAGFTILEVLIALIIVALVAATLAQTAQGVRAAAQRSELRVNAVLIAQSLLEQYAASPVLSAPNQVRGAAPPFTWLVGVEPYQSQQPALGLVRVTAHVAWTSDKYSGAVDLKTLRLAR